MFMKGKVSFQRRLHTYLSLSFFLHFTSLHFTLYYYQPSTKVSTTNNKKKKKKKKRKKKRICTLYTTYCTPLTTRF
ncbi:hypothetical protein F4703DRAFT_1852239 [Phycomyces blakesleeanus]